MSREEIREERREEKRGEEKRGKERRGEERGEERRGEFIRTDQRKVVLFLCLTPPSWQVLAFSSCEKVLIDNVTDQLIKLILKINSTL